MFVPVPPCAWLDPQRPIQILLLLFQDIHPIARFLAEEGNAGFLAEEGNVGATTPLVAYDPGP